MSCVVAINATCPMQLVLYFYDELQVVIATKKCSCKHINCKTPNFFHNEPSRKF